MFNDREGMVFENTPIGEGNACHARQIWKVIDCWAESSIQNKLNELALAGRIKRGKQETKSGFRWIYWREAA